MEFIFQRVYISISISLSSFIQLAQADISSDAEFIFNNAQQVYSTYFPSVQETRSAEPWLYRYYPSNGSYLGINKNDLGVYVLGGSFGESPIYIDDKNKIMQFLNNLKKGFRGGCENVPEGVLCKQNGYTINQTTSNQCINIPQDDSPKPETDINILSKTDTTTLELNGISSSSPSRQSLLNAGLQTYASKCTIHVQGNPPEDLSNYKVIVDVCIDVTDGFINIADDVDIIEFNPPITVKIIGTETHTLVSDCFSTDAAGIFNKVTKERWLRKNGEFVKIQ